MAVAAKKIEECLEKVELEAKVFQRELREMKINIKISRVEETIKRILETLDQLKQQSDHQEMKATMTPATGDSKQALDIIYRSDTRVRHVELPIFDGTDPDGWVFTAERLLALNRIRETEKLEVAVGSLDGEAWAWFQREDGRWAIHSWVELKLLIVEQFHTPQERSPCENYLALRHESTVKEYHRQWDNMVAPLSDDPDLDINSILDHNFGRETVWEWLNEHSETLTTTMARCRETLTEATENFKQAQNSENSCKKVMSDCISEERNSIDLKTKDFDDPWVSNEGMSILGSLTKETNGDLTSVSKGSLSILTKSYDLSDYSRFLIESIGVEMVASKNQETRVDLGILQTDLKIDPRIGQSKWDEQNQRVLGKALRPTLSCDLENLGCYSSLGFGSRFVPCGDQVGGDTNGDFWVGSDAWYRANLFSLMVEMRDTSVTDLVDIMVVSNGVKSCLSALREERNGSPTPNLEVSCEVWITSSVNGVGLFYSNTKSGNEAPISKLTYKSDDLDGFNTDSPTEVDDRGGRRGRRPATSIFSSVSTLFDVLLLGGLDKPKRAQKYMWEKNISAKEMVKMAKVFLEGDDLVQLKMVEDGKILWSVAAIHKGGEATRFGGEQVMEDDNSWDVLLWPEMLCFRLIAFVGLMAIELRRNTCSFLFSRDQQKVAVLAMGKHTLRNNKDFKGQSV